MSPNITPGSVRPIVPPSVNYHLTKACNMRCNFCFATFHDLEPLRVDPVASMQLIEALAQYGFQKITFAGGEPTLVKELPELLAFAKEQGLVTTIVTNGSRLLEGPLLDQLLPFLDWIALSIDSVDAARNLQSGRRYQKDRTLSEADVVALFGRFRAAGLKTKINTVVSQANHTEDLSGLIRQVRPDRWKVLQALAVDGQNSAHQGQFEVTAAEYAAFRARQGTLPTGTAVVWESTALIQGSYIMVSPEGTFFDDTKGAHTYSEPILEVGVEAALSQVHFEYGVFEERGGFYRF